MSNRSEKFLILRTLSIFWKYLPKWEGCFKICLFMKYLFTTSTKRSNAFTIKPLFALSTKVLSSTSTSSKAALSRTGSTSSTPICRIGRLPGSSRETLSSLSWQWCFCLFYVQDWQLLCRYCSEDSESRGVEHSCRQNWFLIKIWVKNKYKRTDLTKYRLTCLIL